MRWFEFRRAMISPQLFQFDYIWKRLRDFVDQVQHRVNKSWLVNPKSQTAIRVKLEKSFIGFLEAQAYTRAYLEVEAGDESDVKNLYEWWQALWEKVEFENLLPTTKTDSTFPVLVRQGLTPSQLLWKFLRIERNGRYQNLCAVWLVTHWMEACAPEWSLLLTRKLQRFRSRASRLKFKSEALLPRLAKLGLPQFEDHRKFPDDPPEEEGLISG